MQKAKYDIDKIKFSVEPKTFKRAIKLYESGKVKKFKEDECGFFAVVSGTDDYEVCVSKKNLNNGYCNCYMGKNDFLCKHMVALAICGVLGGRKMKKEEKEIVAEPFCSSKKGILNEEELSKTKKKITEALRYIKAYTGPSKIWFAYTYSLAEGCARLSDIVSKLPVSKQTAELLVNLLLRLDKKLCTGGVDDSDGAVREFMEELVFVLEEYVKIDKDCALVFKKLASIESCFDWEKPLLRYIK